MTTHAAGGDARASASSRDAAATIADPQVRNRGTIGGSLAHGDPASDMPAVVLALDGDDRRRGRRRAARDRRRRTSSRTTSTTALEPHEVDHGDPAARPDGLRLRLREVQPPPGGLGDGRRRGARQAGGRRRQRRAHRPDPHGSTPLRATAAEEALRGQPLNAETIAAAAEQAAEGTNPPADLNATAGLQAPPGAGAVPARAGAGGRDGLTESRRRDRGPWPARATSPTGASPPPSSSPRRSSSRCCSRARPASARPRSPRRWRRRCGARLIRLQCHEGIDVHQALYDWDYARQLLAIRAAEAGGERGALYDRALPAAPAAARGARGRRAGRAADRRDRPRRRRVRGVPARAAVGLPGLDPGARDGRRAARRPARRPHLQPHARAARRAEAPLPVPLDRLPDAGARARDRRARGCPACRRRSRRACARRWRRLRAEDLYKLPGVGETITWARALLALGDGRVARGDARRRAEGPRGRRARARGAGCSPVPERRRAGAARAGRRGCATPGARVGVGEVLAAHRALAAVDPADRARRLPRAARRRCARRGATWRVFDAAWAATFPRPSRRSTRRWPTRWRPPAPRCRARPCPPATRRPRRPATPAPVPAAYSDEELLLRQGLRASTRRPSARRRGRCSSASRGAGRTRRVAAHAADAPARRRRTTCARPSARRCATAASSSSAASASRRCASGRWCWSSTSPARWRRTRGCCCSTRRRRSPRAGGSRRSRSARG